MTAVVRYAKPDVQQVIINGMTAAVRQEIRFRSEFILAKTVRVITAAIFKKSSEKVKALIIIARPAIEQIQMNFLKKEQLIEK